MAMSVDERRKVLLEWSLLTDGQRSVFGYPTDRAGFALSIGSSDRTLARDAADPEFQAALAARRREIAAVAAPGAILDASEASQALASLAVAGAVAGGGFDTAMPRALSVLAELVEAKDKGAIQILMSTPAAKSWFEAQQADTSSEFRDMSPLELARTNCEYIETELLRQILAERLAA